MKLTSPDGSQTGFVLPITVDDLAVVSKTTFPVQINIANSQFKKTYTTAISLLSGVLNLEIVRIDAPVLVNTMQEVQVKFGSLGEPSCALISYKLNGLTTYYAKIGSNPTACSVYYTNIKASYSSVYAVSSNVWKFGVSVGKTGLVSLFVNITDSFGGETMVGTDFNVMSPLVECQNPVLDIERKFGLFYNPGVYKRSDLFVLVGSTDVRCNVSLSNRKEWIVARVDEKTGKCFLYISMKLC